MRTVPTLHGISITLQSDGTPTHTVHQVASKRTCAHATESTKKIRKDVGTVNVIEKTVVPHHLFGNGTDGPPGEMQTTITTVFQQYSVSEFKTCVHIILQAPIETASKEQPEPPITTVVPNNPESQQNLIQVRPVNPKIFWSRSILEHEKHKGPGAFRTTRTQWSRTLSDHQQKQQYRSEHSYQ